MPLTTTVITRSIAMGECFVKCLLASPGRPLESLSGVAPPVWRMAA